MLLTGLVFTTIPAYATNIPNAEELFLKIEKLTAIVEQQGAMIEEQRMKIKELEGCYGECKIRIDKHDKELNVFKSANRDISGRLKRQFERMEGMCAAGLNIGGGMTFVGQGVSGANAPGSGGTDLSDHGNEDSRFDGSYSIDLEIAKQFEDYGLAFVHIETGDGDTVEGDLALFSNVNRDADNSDNVLSLTEAWYEHYFFDHEYIITVGKIDAHAYIDTNKFANDETTQFLGHLFRNSAVIDFPDGNNFGVRANIAPEFMPYVEIGAFFMEEDADWNNIFDEPFVGGQLTFKPAEAFKYDKEQWEGNYRVYLWHNGAPYQDVKNPGVMKRGLIGFGFNFDQMLTQTYGLFGRFSWADPQRSNMEYDWSFGGSMTGEYWGREEDTVAVAIGQVVPGEPFRDINQFHDPETHFETYYSFKVNQSLTISPDLQVIWDPNGGGTPAGEDDSTIMVYGVRGQVDF